MTMQDQPAYIIKMRGKAGLGDKLFELVTEGMKKSGSSDRFIIAPSPSTAGGTGMRWSMPCRIPASAAATAK